MSNGQKSGDVAKYQKVNGIVLPCWPCAGARLKMASRTLAAWPQWRGIISVTWARQRHYTNAQGQLELRRMRLASEEELPVSYDAWRQCDAKLYGPPAWGMPSRLWRTASEEAEGDDSAPSAAPSSWQFNDTSEYAGESGLAPVSEHDRAARLLSQAGIGSVHATVKLAPNHRAFARSYATSPSTLDPNRRPCLSLQPRPSRPRPYHHPPTAAPSALATLASALTRHRRSASRSVVSYLGTRDLSPAPSTSTADSLWRRARSGQG